MSAAAGCRSCSEAVILGVCIEELVELLGSAVGHVAGIVSSLSEESGAGRKAVPVLGSCSSDFATRGVGCSGVSLAVSPDTVPRTTAQAPTLSRVRARFGFCLSCDVVGDISTLFSTSYNGWLEYREHFAATDMASQTEFKSVIEWAACAAAWRGFRAGVALRAFEYSSGNER